MIPSRRYVKIVEWSEAGQVYIGSAPGLIFGGCHGPDERADFVKLCQIVDEAVALYEEEGTPLPPATAGRDISSALEAAE